MKRSAIFFAAASLVGVASLGGVPAAFAAAAYEAAIVPPAVGGGPTYYRIDVAAGQVVYVAGTQFTPTVDSTPLPQGDYHLHLAATPDGKSYWLYKMDSQSGRAWFLSNGRWTEITAPK
jgi:gamma-glutamylcyclotransferase (GGCT)/AIG2-like uncharacterized protein YtfP